MTDIRDYTLTEILKHCGWSPLYNIFGDELNAVTNFNQLIPDIGTYDGRNFGGNYCPGILLNNFTLTL